jgi:hypothetical protein
MCYYNHLNLNIDKKDDCAIKMNQVSTKRESNCLSKIVI